MDTRRIGTLDVSVVGLGCNNFGRRIDADATAAVVDAALSAGITFLDTANMYGEGLSEEYLGRALQGRRNRVILATKVGLPMEGEQGGGAPAYVRAAAERSLQRLRTDHIDLYQLHEPDPSVPIADTLGAMDALIREGKVREIGCSNFSAEQLREARAAAESSGLRAFVSVQNHYSMLHREPEADVLATAEAFGMAFLPFYPLEAGLLTGKLRAGAAPPSDSRLSEERYQYLITPDRLSAVDRLASFADARGRTLIELAFAWLLSRGVVASVIAGARTAKQARTNASAGAWQLNEGELAEIDLLLS